MTQTYEEYVGELAARKAAIIHGLANIPCDDEVWSFLEELLEGGLLWAIYRQYGARHVVMEFARFAERDATVFDGYSEGMMYRDNARYLRDVSGRLM